jgi:hypothetical protein
MMVFNISWRNIQFLLTNCCTSIEKERILAATMKEINETFARHSQDHNPEADMDFSPPGGMQRSANEILQGRNSGTAKPINYDKFRGIIL